MFNLISTPVPREWLRLVIIAAYFVTDEDILYTVSIFKIEQMHDDILCLYTPKEAKKYSLI